jgi:hypothetical protein
MNTTTQIVGLLIWFASFAVFWRAYSSCRKLPAALIWPGYVALLPLAFLIRGLFGDASLALPALSLLLAKGESIRPEARRLLLVVSVFAWTLEISALGFISYDLYATGYAPGVLIFGVAGLLAAAHRYLRVLSWSWLLGLALSTAGLHPSPNLWDALIDVPSLILAAAILVRTPRPQSG